MSDNVASPESTGGAGYSFEHCEAAWWALCMLLGRPVLDTEFGVPISIRLQLRVDDWRLDDLVAEFPAVDDRPRFAAVSAKKEKFVNSNGFDQSFVEECWQQLVQPGKSGFDPNRDRLVLCCGDLAETVSGAVSDLIGLASGDPTSFASRIAVPRWSNSLVRTLADSFACPPTVSATTPQKSAPGELLQSVRVLQRDWLIPSSRSQADAIQRAREAVSSGAEQDAKRLWAILRDLARDLSRTSGVIDLNAISDAVRGQVELRAIPDYTAAWRTLRETTARWRSESRTSLGGRCNLPREELRRQVRKQITDHVVSGVVGSTGSGKSALVRAAIEEELADATTFVLAARCSDLAQIAAKHGSALVEALALVPARNAFLVLDSAEHLEQTPDVTSVTRLLDRLRVVRPERPWRVVVVARGGSLEGALGRLAASVDEIPAACPSIEVGDLSREELDVVAEAFPGLRRLLRHEAQRRILARPQVLDMLVRPGLGNLPDAFPTTTALHDWFWTQFVSLGPDGDLRATVGKQIATHLAEHNLHRIPVERLSVPQVAQLAELESRGILRRSNETVSFAHDTYAALAKERALLGRVEAEGAKGLPDDVSGWADGLALLSLRLLEAGPIQSFSWDQLYKSLGQGGTAVQGPDIATDALFTAVDVPAVLSAALPTLLEDEGAALRRMLRRIAFSWSALRPDLHEPVAGLDLGNRWRIESRIESRLPIGQGWFALMAWLSQKPQSVLEETRPEVFDLSRLWINFSYGLGDKNLVYAESAADLVLAEAEAECRGEYAPRPARERVITTALLCHHWFPKRTARIIRTLAGIEPLPLPESLSRPARPFDREKDDGTASLLTALRIRGPLPEPWKIGPLRRPSSELRKVVLSSPGADYLVAFSPELAQEVFLGVLISAPSERCDDRLGTVAGLEYDVCSPPTCWFPPVLALLARDPTFAISFAATLIDFATDRWLERWSEQGLEAGTSLTMADGTVRQFRGDAAVFAWSRAGTNGPDSLKSVLMTLESWLYEQLDGEKTREPAARLLEQLLDRSSSAASLGLLCDVGLRFHGLLASELEPLVTGRELYWWTIQRHPVIDMSMAGWWSEPQQEQQRMREFHQLRHRRYDFQKVVIHLLFGRNFQWPALIAGRDRWLADSVDGDLFYERLAASFDSDNWQAHETEGQTLWELTLPAELQRQSDAEARAANMALEQSLGPFKWASMLSGSAALDDDAVFAELRRLAQKSDSGPPSDEPLSSVMAAAAVGIVRCAERLETEPEIAACCRSWLLAPCSAPPAREPLDRRGNRGLAPWDEFCAKGVATLWAKNPGDRELRQAVAKLAVGPHDETTAALVQTAAQHRDRLGRDFGLLVELGVFLSRALHAITQRPSRERVGEWVAAIRDATDEFVQGRPYTRDATWTSIATERAPLRVFGRLRIRLRHGFRKLLGRDLPARSIHELERWINVELEDHDVPEAPLRDGFRGKMLSAAVAWATADAREGSAPGGRTGEIIESLAQAVALSASAAAKRSGRKSDQRLIPRKEDRELTDIVAAYLARFPSEVERVAAGYFGLPESCSLFLVDLTRSIYIEWLRGDTDFSTRVAVLEVLMTQTVSWYSRFEQVRRRHDRAEVLSCLLGTNLYSPTAEVWPAPAAEYLAALLVPLERWWALAAKESKCVAAFCTLLRAPACETFRRDCLRWIEPKHVHGLLGVEWWLETVVSLLEVTAPTALDEDPHWISLAEAASADGDAGALALVDRLAKTSRR